MSDVWALSDYDLGILSSSMSAGSAAMVLGRSQKWVQAKRQEMCQRDLPAATLVVDNPPRPPDPPQAAEPPPPATVTPEAEGAASGRTTRAYGKNGPRGVDRKRADAKLYRPDVDHPLTDAPCRILEANLHPAGEVIENGHPAFVAPVFAKPESLTDPADGPWTVGDWPTLADCLSRSPFAEDFAGAPEIPADPDVLVVDMLEAPDFARKITLVRVEPAPVAVRPIPEQFGTVIYDQPEPMPARAIRFARWFITAGWTEREVAWLFDVKPTRLRAALEGGETT